MATPAPLPPLARTLVQQKLCDEEAAAKAVNDSQENKVGLVTALVRTNAIKPLDLMTALSERFSVPMLNLDAVELGDEVTKMLERKLLEKYHVLPLSKQSKHIHLAVADPTAFASFDEIKFNTGLQVIPILVEEDKLTKKLDEITSSMEGNLDDIVGETSIEMEDAEGGETDLEDDAAEDAPVVKLVQHILVDSIQQGASDIHIEPYEKDFRVRYRRDGMLHDVLHPPLKLKEGMASRLKIMSKLNIAERRVPQDGRLRVRLSKERAIDFRVSFCPTLYGEKIVLRLLDPNSAKMGIEALGFLPEQQESLLDAVHRPYGMVLVTGPTGSGKTVTLYTCLNILNTPEKNISTAEDPVEINLYGINQVNVNDRVGMTFSAALKSFLRQDPDIVMVGEIRDLETAEIAVKAAQTGHMVLSTLHTNDAPQTLTRLQNMGIPSYNIVSSVILVLAQRLGRRLCKECKQPLDVPEKALLEAGFKKEQLNGEWRPLGPVGCDVCKNSGYKARVGLYQTMPISEGMRDIILKGGSASDLSKQAQKEGISNLRQSGLRRVMDGTTSLEEVLRVTNE